MSSYFLLKDETRRQNAINYIKAMNISRPMEVTIKPYKKNRSNSQNRLYWMWIGIIADETGYTEEDLHELLKVRLLGAEEKTVWGQQLVVAKSTTRLSTMEFTEYLNKIELTAMEMGLTLPHPEDLYLEAMRNPVPAVQSPTHAVTTDIKQPHGDGAALMEVS